MRVFDLSLYNDEFFECHLKYARDYSIKTMDWYLSSFPMESVVDFGCGIGSYLEIAHSLGLKVKGYEISEVAKKYTSENIQKFIEYRDCTLPIIPMKSYDTVLSFETAEHIRAEGTQQFVNNILNAVGKHLLFTAAPPGQQGTGHINLQPREFWIAQFSELDYNQELTDFIATNWQRIGAPKYICDNLIVCTA